MHGPAWGARALVLSALAASTMAASAPEALRLRQLSGAPAAVVVEDALGAPVEGAIVTFQLGPGASFASGLRTEVVTSDDKGRAQVMGILAAGAAPPPSMKVTAVFQGARATLEFSVPARSREAAAPRSFNKKWLVIALAAGGAAGALALGGRASGSGSAPAVAGAITAPPVTPSLGRPVVIVTTPPAP